MVSKSMLESLLQKQLSYEPERQSYHTFQNGSWQSSTQNNFARPAISSNAVTSFHLITWNIDFMASQPRARMAAAVNYLGELISRVPKSSAMVVFLQEMMESENEGAEHAKDLSQLASAAWVQEGFHMTDVDSSQWESPYGQVTLIDRRLAISDVFRLRFVSEYQRDALFVDVRLATESEKILRLCNVHLDSSYGSMRPLQWKAVAKYLQDTGAAVAGSVLAGDCNSTQPRDRYEPKDNGFRDTYLELGAVEDHEDGNTWGYQSLASNQWGPRRLDKEVFWGDIRAKSLERIGVGVRVQDEVALQELELEGGLPFVTDHYGLMGEFDIKDGLMQVTDQ